MHNLTQKLTHIHTYRGERESAGSSDCWIIQKWKGMIDVGRFISTPFKRSLLAPAPNRPSGLCSSKPGMDLAFLVMLFGTRVALFCGRGTSGGGWDSTPVFAPYPIIESCMLFWARSTKCFTHEELGVKNPGSQFDVAGKPEGLQISLAGCSYTQEHMSLKDKHILNGKSTYSLIVTDALLASFISLWKLCLNVKVHGLQ